ncbi:MAG: NUDIX hydrolase [Candidatus Eremiobacteraeota bacterium]|nr:NUDIX hydrolase [Candidatus Eremiobacteraeota bacterium]
MLLEQDVDKLNKKKLRRLNRLILENIYPHEIARNNQNPSVTVDIVIFTIQHEKLCVLLIKRKYPPYKGKWAIPGGFVKYKEPLEDAAIRELEEETGVKEVYIEQLYTFGEPRRDPRKRVITVAYFALISSENLVVRPDTDVSDVRWYSVYKLPKLAFDHERIVNYALTRLRNKIMYANVAFQLLSDEFTLTELQKAYEVILDKKLDKRNFRKKIISSKILEETGNKKLEGRHRPARLYRFSAEDCLEDYCLPKKESGK